MKHIFTLFLVFLLPTLPAFGATQSVSKNNELFFSVKGEFTGYTGLFPSGVQVKITSPSECYITLAHKPKSDRILNSTFDRSIACPTGTNSITLEFTSNQTGVGQAKYTVKNPTHTIEIKSTKKNYKLPDIVLVQTNKSTSATPAQKKETKPAPRDTYDELQTVGEIHAADAESDAKYSGQQNTSKKSEQTSITNICKSSAHRLNCANMTITCTDGFVNGMTQEKALQLLCPGDVAAEQQRRKQIKESANNRFCKSGMTFSDQCSSNQVTFGCAEYSRHAPNEIKKALKNYCNSKKENNVIVKDNGAEKSVQKKAQSDINFELSGKFEIDNASLPSNITATLSPSACKSVASKYFSGKNFSKNYKCPAGTTSVTFTFLTEDKKAQTKYDIQNATQTVNLTGAKKYTLGQPIKFVPKTISVGKNDPSKQEIEDAENDRKKELCKSPNTWNDTLNKCTCKDKKQFFDDELGCTAASQAFTNAEKELNTLKGQLDTKLTELANANESEAE